jgi:hypothetical protein
MIVNFCLAISEFETVLNLLEKAPLLSNVSKIPFKQIDPTSWAMSSARSLRVEGVKGT